MMNVEFQAQVLKDRSFEILELYNSVEWAQQMMTSGTLINAPPGSVLDAHTAQLYVTRISNGISLCS